MGIGANAQSPQQTSLASNSAALPFIVGLGLAIALLTFGFRARLDGPGIVPVIKVFILLCANTSLIAGFMIPSHRLGWLPRTLPFIGLIVANGTILVLAPYQWGGIVIYPLLLIMIGCGYAVVAQPIRALSRYMLTLFLVGIAAGAIYFFFSNSLGYAHIFVQEAALIGSIHDDTVFHAATAAMVARFGAVSTGLDGLTFVANHPLSHLVIGRLAMWLDVTPLMAYAFVPRILFLPTLLLALIGATASYSHRESRSAAALYVVLLPIVLLLVFELVSFPSYIVSESYQLALILLLLSIPFISRFADCRSPIEILSGILAIIIAVLATSLAKMTVGFCLAGGVGFMLLAILVRRAMYRVLVLGSILGIAGMCLIGALMIEDAEFRVRILDLFGVWEFPDRYGLWAYSNIGLASVGVVVPIAAAYLSGWEKLPAAALLSGTAATALVSGVIASAPAGAQYYLVNVGCWIAFLAIAAFLLLPATAKRGLGRQSVLALLLMGGLAVVVGKSWSIGEFRELVESLDTRAAAASEAFAREHGETGPPAKATLSENASAGFVGQLQTTLARNLEGDDGSTLVFIPASVEQFWSVSPSCLLPGWIVPAIQWTPMVNGVNSTCENLRYYGFEAYPPEARNNDAPDEVICERVLKLGFRTLLRVLDARSTRRVDCANGKFSNWTGRQGLG